MDNRTEIDYAIESLAHNICTKMFSEDTLINDIKVLVKKVNDEKLKDLTPFDDEELKTELTRREIEAIPKIIENPNFEALKKICSDYIDTLSSTGQEQKDIHHYIYEVSLECCFGKSVWGWINEKLK
jgi:hypothetical protein